MDIYDPIASPTKAFIGQVGDPHVFLGYELSPGSYPPSPAARDKLIGKIGTLITEGQRSISKAVNDRKLTSQDRCYAQTLVAVDQTIRGWQGSFKSSNCPELFKQLDTLIDRRLYDFRAFFLGKIAKHSPAHQRRALGVSLLHASAPAP